MKEMETGRCTVQRRPASLDQDFCKKTEAGVKNSCLKDSLSKWNGSRRFRVMSCVVGDRKCELLERKTVDLKQASSGC